MPFNTNVREWVLAQLNAVDSAIAKEPNSKPEGFLLKQCPEDIDGKTRVFPENEVAYLIGDAEIHAEQKLLNELLRIMLKDDVEKNKVQSRSHF